jgi:hypothetical protein
VCTENFHFSSPSVTLGGGASPLLQHKYLQHRSLSRSYLQSTATILSLSLTQAARRHDLPHQAARRCDLKPDDLNLCRSDDKGVALILKPGTMHTVMTLSSSPTPHTPTLVVLNQASGSA